MSYLSQMAGLAVQNFVSARVGMAVLVGRDPRLRAPLGERRSATSGSTSTARSPTSCCRWRSSSRCVLVSQGVVADVRRRTRPRRRSRARTQTIARGPVASQIAIKQLGTNGGGFYNSNSAVPFENPNGVHQLPRDARDPADPGGAGLHVRPHGRRAPPGAGRSSARCSRCSRSASRSRCPAEQHGSQVLRDSGVNITQGDGQSGGNMEDKEVRFGIADTALWASATTNASNGSVNGGHDALTAHGRRRADRQHVHRRGDLRRRRLRPLRHVLLRPHRRLRRRADGRAHAGVPRQEDRGARDQARRGRRALRADDGARPDGDLGRHRPRAGVDLQPRRARLHRGALRLHSQSNNNGSAFAGYGATDFSALVGIDRALARPVRAAASPRSRSAARWPRKKTVPAVGRHVPHRRRRRSRCCSSA